MSSYYRSALTCLDAPQPIGAYSQAIISSSDYRTVHFSGTIPLDKNNVLITESIQHQINQVFDNIEAIANTAGGSLNNVVKLNVYLTNLDDLKIVNEAISRYFNVPLPARTTIGVHSLPFGVAIEVDGEMRI